MYITKIPELIKPIFNQFTWSVNTDEKIVYLTFDDGPHPDITLKVLSILKQYQAKATFFCVGNNIEKYPFVFQSIINDGHSVGNHTFNHENGWKTNNYSYYKSIIQTQQKYQFKLFRPPYGRISKSQTAVLKNKFELIMWDVLSGDFDKSKSVETCLNDVISNIHPGAIVVFHDSNKARKNMLYTLPRALNILSNQGYVFHSLSERLAK